MTSLWAGSTAPTADASSRTVDTTGDPSIRAGMFIGSSEWGHLLSEQPYGCQRKLYLDKIGAERTDPHLDYESNAMYRGKRMESVIISEYESFTGYSVEPVTGYELPDSLPLWWRPRPDGFVRDHGIAIEAKNPSASGTWRTYQREGMPPSWIMQAQAHMAALGCDLASFVIIPWGSKFELWAPDGEVPKFPRKPDMIESMIELGGRFLDRCRAGDEPEAQDHIECKACGSCPYLTHCHGRGAAADLGDPAGHDVKVLDADAEAQALAAQYARLKDIEGDTKDALDEWKVKADALLKRHDSEAIRVGGETIRRVVSNGAKRLDAKKVKAKYGDEYDSLCTVGAPSASIRFFGRKA